MPAPRRLMLAVIAIALVAMPSVAFAQDATPTAGADPDAKIGARPAVSAERLDLAAMVLPSEDQPTGVALRFKSYVPMQVLVTQLASGGITAADIEKIGLTSFYQSIYAAADRSLSVRTYVEEFGSVSGVTAGFKLLEDESRFAGAAGSTTFKDKPGIGVGEEPSEVTVSTETAADGQASISGLDATFRVGRLLAGVSIETTGPTPPDETLLADLSRKLADRINAELNGDAIAGIDPTLPVRLIAFASDPASNVDVLEGYVSAVDSFGPSTPKTAIDAYTSGYVHSTGLGVKVDPRSPLPIVTLSLSSFSSESGPLAIMTDSAKLTPPYVGLKSVRLDPIAGTSATAGFSYANPFTNAKPDSFRIVAAVGDVLATVDVQGAPTLEDARRAAESLIAQQITCLAASGKCAPATLPAGFGAPHADGFRPS